MEDGRGVVRLAITPGPEVAYRTHDPSSWAYRPDLRPVGAFTDRAQVGTIRPGGWVMSSVRDFGARGDGQADDTAAILHAVEKGDGQLVFLRGDYLISRPILIPL